MSVEAMSWVLNHAPVSGTDKVVLIGLANHAGADGDRAYPSVARLARYANVTERAVQQSLRRLEAAGLITVKLQAGGDRDCPEDKRPNLYRVVMSSPSASSAAPDPGPVDSDSDGVQAASPRDQRGVKCSAPRGEAQRADGVKPTSPKPSENHPPTVHARPDLAPPVDERGVWGDALQEMIRREELEQPPGVIRNRARWRAAVSSRLTDEHIDRAVALLVEFPTVSAAQLADALLDGTAPRHVPRRACPDPTCDRGLVEDEHGNYSRCPSCSGAAVVA